MLNMHWEPHTFSIPHTDGEWCLAVDTSREDRNGIFEEPELLSNQETFEMEARSIVVLLSEGRGGNGKKETAKKDVRTEKEVLTEKEE